MDSFVRLLRAIVLLASLSVLAGCPPPTSSVPPVAQSLSLASTDGTNSWGFSPSASLDKTREVTVNLTMPGGTSRLAYLFTNTSTVASAQASLTGAVAEGEPTRTVGALDRSTVGHPALPHRVAFPDVWTAFDWRTLPVSARALDTRPPSQAVVTPVLDDPYTFKDHSFDGNYTLILTPSHLRYKTTVVSGRLLNLWVADDCYDATGDGLGVSKPLNGTPWNPPAHLVTHAMLVALATKFLDQSNSGNDIYTWVTNVFGPEWAAAKAIPAPANTFIDGNGDIHIFIKNLNPSGSNNGGILEGYFDPTNNFLTTARTWSSESNQMVLFALDADTLATSATTQPAWQITDPLPSEAVSTLAHEFQHMIHFYQKQVLQGTNWTDAWVNEMASMMTEDLVADKLVVAGPRGVANTDFTAGPPANQNGRLPEFNYWHETIPLTGWGNNSTAYTVLDSYSNAYAFGAWLLRNYGGVTLLHNLVTNGYVDYQAVVAAVNTSPVTLGAPQTFESLVRDWGLATFLKSSSVRPGLKYHATTSDVVGGIGGDGNTFSFDYGSGPINYKFGSIDLANYRYTWTLPSPGYYDGPYIYTSLPHQAAVAAGSTLFLDEGPFTTGSAVNRVVLLPPNVALSVVVTP